MTTDITEIQQQSWQHKRGTIGEVVTRSEDIKQCINNIIGIIKGEVPLLPELGTDITDAIGEKTQDSIDIATAIFSREIPKQEPRVEVITVSGDFNEDGEIKIVINYREKASGIEDYTEVFL